MAASLADVDHLGERRLSRRATALWYSIAFVTYVSSAIWHKWLLTWILGPVWLVATVWFGPIAWDTLKRLTGRATNL
jgi:hypothetical protein